MFDSMNRLETKVTRQRHDQDTNYERDREAQTYHCFKIATTRPTLGYKGQFKY